MDRIVLEEAPIADRSAAASRVFAARARPLARVEWCPTMAFAARFTLVSIPI